MTPILHHFEISPFAEKVRAIFVFKRMDWHSVWVPAAMPKPDLTALTAGNRRTPNLQIGAAIYCDTAPIAQVIEALRVLGRLSETRAGARRSRRARVVRAVPCEQDRAAGVGALRTPQAIEALMQRQVRGKVGIAPRALHLGVAATTSA